MNRLSAILPASQVLVDVDASSKKRVFEHAGLLFENQHAIARAIVTDNLFARERLGSTGLGHGVAIPHGRIKGLKNPLAAVIRLSQPMKNGPEGPLTWCLPALATRNQAHQARCLRLAAAARAY